jgi:4-amino-4-deoxy-L-arabinose transferase-like glycosyltransferase
MLIEPCNLAFSDGSLLASAFCMLAFIAYLKSRDRAKPVYYWTSLILFVFAVLSKTTTVILPPGAGCIR